MELRDYSELICNAHKVISSEAFGKGKITGSGYVRELLTSDFVGKLYRIGEITEEDHKLLQSVFSSTEDEISRGNKVKIRNILFKRVIPVIENYVEQTDDIDLGLTPVDQVLEEIKASKTPIRITGGPAEQESKIKVIGLKHEPEMTLEEADYHREELAKQKETEKDTLREENTSEKEKTPEEEKTENIEYTQKNILSEQQKTLIRQLRTKLYSKDKIEIFPNQLLSSFISGDESLNSYKVDMVICDKETYNIICAVVIVDRVEIDFTATLLNKLNIKRFVVKHSNGMLDTQDIRALEEEINNRYAPMCKMCGLPMMQKENIKTRHRFYACMDNQRCRYTIDMGD